MPEPFNWVGYNIGTTKVVAAEPKHSPLSKPEKPVMFVNMVELLLEDETIQLGCTWCNYHSEKVGQVRAHYAHNCLARPEIEPKTPKMTRGVEGDKKVNGEGVDISDILLGLLGDQSPEDDQKIQPDLNMEAKIRRLEKRVDDHGRFFSSLRTNLRQLLKELDKKPR